MKDKRRSERSIQSEHSHHINKSAEDYNPSTYPSTTLEPPSQHESISRDNTVTLSSNKDENLDEGIDGKENPEEGQTSQQQVNLQYQQLQQQHQQQVQILQSQQQAQQQQDQGSGSMERKGSIVRNGVYYSESELSEENPWQPKYWTPDRIGKWVEDTEFPEGLKYSDVCKVVIQNHMTVPRPRATPHHQSPAHISLDLT